MGHCNQKRGLGGFELGKVLINDPLLPQDVRLPPGSRTVDIETLLEEADYITLYAPLTRKTHHLFGAGKFRPMEREAILINTSWGGLIDTTALTSGGDAEE